MDSTHEKYMDRLNGLLQKKRGLLQEILDLTRLQTAAVDGEDLEKLQKLIEDKQTKIDAVDKLDEEFNVYFQRLKSTLKVKSLSELDASGMPGASQLKETTAGILKLITAIGDIEKVNGEKSKRLLDSFGSEIKKLNQGKRVNSVYAPPPLKPPSYFIDKKK